VVRIICGFSHTKSGLNRNPLVAGARIGDGLDKRAGLVAITVRSALVGAVLWGTLSGSMLPFILRRVGADPAASSAAFVAMVVDVTGLVIYFSVALLIIRGALL
jgi:Mg/Co/Ni transporter MgtE